MNYFYKNILDKNLNSLKLLMITLFIFFFDIKFKIFSILIDLRLFSLFLFLIMLYEIRSLKKINFFFCFLFILLLFHYFLNTLINKIPINFYSIFKIISAFLISSSIYYYKEFILKNFNIIINLFLIIFFLILTVSNIINFFYGSFAINCFYGCFSVNRFLYLENSHLAYFSSLIIFYYIHNFSNKENIKYFPFFLFFLISLIKNQSTTLLVSNILITVFFFIFFSKKFDKLKVISFLCIFVVSTIFIFNSFHKQKIEDFSEIISSQNNDFSQNKDFSENKDQENLTFILSRLNTSHVKNLSSDVYFFNFKIALNSLVDRPFGWGLFNYQSAHQKYSKITKSYLEGSSWLNSDDGTNILFKSIVELGFFSLILWVPFLFFLFNRKIDFHYKLLIAPPVITQVLIRGSGFFNGGFVVFIILYFYLLLKKN